MKTEAKAGHTPGPWETFSNYKGGVPLLIRRVGWDCAIAWLPDGSGKPGEIIEANARLIAAAPECLEACKRVADGLTCKVIIGEPRAHCECWSCETYRQVKAVIEKAEGRQ